MGKRAFAAGKKYIRWRKIPVVLDSLERYLSLPFEWKSAHAGARHGRKDKRRQRDHLESADWRQHGDVCLGSNGNPPWRGRSCCSEEEKEIIGDNRTDSRESDTVP